MEDGDEIAAAGVGDGGKSLRGAAWLPEEAMREILLRLPKRCLCRFRSVCKLFDSIISDPSFLRSYSGRVLMFQIRSNEFWKLDSIPLITFRFHSRRSEPSPELEEKQVTITPPPGMDEHLLLIDTCGPALCFTGQRSGCHYIYNTLVGDWHAGLPPPADGFCEIHWETVAFFFHRPAKEYRLLIMRRYYNYDDYYYDDDDNICNDGDRKHEFKVYSPGTRSWRFVGSCCPAALRHQSNFLWFSDPCIMNGKIYWMDFNKDNSKPGEPGFVLSFDTEDESFSHFPAPENNFGCSHCRLFEMEEKLCLFQEFSGTEMALWAATGAPVEASGGGGCGGALWEKLFTISLSSPLEKKYSLRPIGALGSRYVLFAANALHSFYLYTFDLHEKEKLDGLKLCSSPSLLLQDKFRFRIPFLFSG